MKYYPVKKKWRKIKKHLNDVALQNVLVEDFNKFTYGLWKKPFKHGMLPEQFESCDWRCSIKGRPPHYFRYVKHAAGHWLVNFNLKLAMLVEPERQWRIVTCQKHSTVWDGKNTLFDLTYLALGVSPKEAFERANFKKKQLRIGELMTIYFARPGR